MELSAVPATKLLKMGPVCEQSAGNALDAGRSSALAAAGEESDGDPLQGWLERSWVLSWVLSWVSWLGNHRNQHLALGALPGLPLWLFLGGGSESLWIGGVRGRGGNAVTGREKPPGLELRAEVAQGHFWGCG